MYLLSTGMQWYVLPHSSVATFMVHERFQQWISLEASYRFWISQLTQVRVEGCLICNWQCLEACQVRNKVIDSNSKGSSQGHVKQHVLTGRQDLPAEMAVTKTNGFVTVHVRVGQRERSFRQLMPILPLASVPIRAMTLQVFSPCLPVGVAGRAPWARAKGRRLPQFEQPRPLLRWGARARLAAFAVCSSFEKRI
jgi:hypothetical protein